MTAKAMLLTKPKTNWSNGTASSVWWTIARVVMFSIAMETTKPPKHADQASVKVEQRHCEDEGKDRRQNEIVGDRDADDLEGVELLVAPHRRDPRGVGAAGTARHDDRSHHGGHLAHECEADQVGNEDVGGELRSCTAPDKGKDGADQEIDDADNDQGGRSGSARYWRSDQRRVSAPCDDARADHP